MTERIYNIIICVFAAALLAACSTTKRLPEGETLYTGIKAVNIDGKTGSEAEKVAIEELEGVLAYAPNNSLFGSSTMRVPLPIGLWIYNSMEDREYKGIKKWWYNTFSVTPRTISMAAPETRVKVAQNTLQNYGYFSNTVSYNLITGKDPKMQKIEYNVKLGPPSIVDSVDYHFSGIQDSIIQATMAKSPLGPGKQFSAADLQSERTRLATEFHNNGYYYFRPDYIKFYADSINYGGKVRVAVVPEVPAQDKGNRQWKIGRMSAFIRKSPGLQSSGSRMMAYDDTIQFKRLTLGYQGKHIPLKPRVMFRGFKFWTGRLYSEEKVANTLTELSNMGLFSNLAFTFTPADTTDTCNVLDCRLDCTLDKLIDTELQFNFSQKSNSQMGPDLAITFSKRNAFNHGETLSFKVRGAYFFQVRDRAKGENLNNMDSYMFGGDISLAYPWLCFPWLANKFYRLPTYTKFSASFTRENIAGGYRLNKFNVGATYGRQINRYVSHAFSPIDITLVDVRSINDRLLSDSITRASLTMLFSDSYVPGMAYTIKYDNSVDKNRFIDTHVELSLKESGNLISGIQALAGKPFNQQGKNFVFRNYNQFVKFLFELRNNFKLTPKSSIATRLQLGLLANYGNTEDGNCPITESFYAGGANSIRAFSARSLGPGEYPYHKGDPYFLHTGNIKFEVNAEYRFPIFGDLYGALFVDAGNVWSRFTKEPLYTADFRPEMLTPEERELIEEWASINTHFDIRKFPKQLALGTGFGFRYDLSFLVLRLDVGIAIHAPFKTSRSGYYNIPKFWQDGVAFHFSVGYPF